MQCEDSYKTRQDPCWAGRHEDFDCEGIVSPEGPCVWIQAYIGAFGHEGTCVSRARVGLGAGEEHGRDARGAVCREACAGACAGACHVGDHLEALVGGRGGLSPTPAPVECEDEAALAQCKKLSKKGKGCQVKATIKKCKKTCGSCRRLQALAPAIERLLAEKPQAGPDCFAMCDGQCDAICEREVDGGVGSDMEHDSDMDSDVDYMDSYMNDAPTPAPLDDCEDEAANCKQRVNKCDKSGSTAEMCKRTCGFCGCADQANAGCGKSNEVKCRKAGFAEKCCASCREVRRLEDLFV